MRKHNQTGTIPTNWKKKKKVACPHTGRQFKRWDWHHFKITDHYLPLKPVSVPKFSISSCTQVCFHLYTKEFKAFRLYLNTLTFITCQTRFTIPVWSSCIAPIPHKEAETQRREIITVFYWLLVVSCFCSLLLLFYRWYSQAHFSKRVKTCIFPPKWLGLFYF